MAIRGKWTRVFIDRERCFVYGPNLGRLYHLAAPQSLDPAMQKLLGLSAFSLKDHLCDPTERILHDRSSLNGMSPVLVSSRLKLFYRFLHYSRYFVPLQFAAAIVAWMARRFASRTESTVSDIGRLVFGIEQAVGLTDCYPRALLTCYLCLKNGRRCELSLGMLAPTRKMHAWCSTDGQLPYEALPEHYLYRPLLILTLLP